MGDDIAGAHRDSKLRDVTLRMETSGAVPGDALGVTVNDAPREVAECSPENGVELAIEPTSIKQGVNQLVLEIAKRGDSAWHALSIERVRVDVRYRHG